MEIIEYGNPKQEKIILIHGFESPYQVWNDYIDYYKKDYCVIVPILIGHNINEDVDFVSFETCVQELEDYYISKYGSEVFAIYGMSMGGVVASLLWENKRLEIDHGKFSAFRVWKSNDKYIDYTISFNNS